MGREWTIKSFKSGNSSAWRVPASAGIIPGEDWRMVEDGDNFLLQRVAKPKRKFNIEKVAGSAWDLQPLADSDRVFEERPLDWDGPPPVGGRGGRG